MKKLFFEPLDDEEKALMEAIEKGQTSKAKTEKELLEQAREAAKKFIEKNKYVNLRLTESDVSKIKTKAAERGIAYQTLMASILHQYANDKIRAEL